MVLVVLVAPVAAGHAAAQPVRHHLQVPVQPDVARQRVVAALVLQPAAPPLRQPRHHGACPPPAGPDQREAGPVHDQDLSKPVRHVRRVRLEVALREQLLSQLLKVPRQRVCLV